MLMSQYDFYKLKQPFIRSKMWYHVLKQVLLFSTMLNIFFTHISRNFHKFYSFIFVQTYST